MIQLVGISKNISLDIRENFSIRQNDYERKIKGLLEFFEEAVIISTCNRTEVYFTNNEINDCTLNKVFEALEWDLDLKKHVFHIGGKRAKEHIVELASGFHSKILGEDQILGQIKNAYEESIKVNTKRGPLQRIFQVAITCGKEFRTLAKLYEIPVSSASISVNQALSKGAKRFMVIGYGDVGSLATKYILSHNIDKLYIVVRNPLKVHDFEDKRVEVVSFEEKNKKLNDVECIISCTSAPHTVIRIDDIDKDYNCLIFDLAIPRDVDDTIAHYQGIDLYNIDDLTLLDDENKKMRKKRMDEYKWVIDKHLEEFEVWKSVKELSPTIQKLKKCGHNVSEDRIISFNNKSTEENYKQIGEKMIKSTADYFINRAIDVLKEEKLTGDIGQCERILEKVFLNFQQS